MTTDAGQPAGQVPEVAIRRGHGADAPDLIELSARTLRSCYTPFLGTQSVEAWIAQTLDDYVREHVEGAWLARNDAAVYGYCVVKGPVLDLLLVDVNEHGRGIGTLLLEHAEKMLFQKYTEIHLESFVSNAPANAFYLGRGWIKGDRHHDAKSGADVVQFRKTVGEVATSRKPQ